MGRRGISVAIGAPPTEGVLRKARRTLAKLKMAYVTKATRLISFDLVKVRTISRYGECPYSYVFFTSRRLFQLRGVEEEDVEQVDDARQR